MLDMQAIRSGQRFLDLTFGLGFKSARRDDGTEIRFTRHESALLEALIARANRPLSRDHLLTAMSGYNAVRSDRTVDFTVNRLRGKLGCPARAPRFIRALYGEGYVWIAPEGGAGTDEFLIIYPSVAPAACAGDRETAALDGLEEGVRKRLPDGMTMRRCASAREAMAYPSAPFGVEVSFHDANGALHAAVVLTDRRFNKVIAAQRLTFRGPGDESGASACRMAEAMHAAIWRQMVLAEGEIASPASAPLELRANAAQELLMRVNPGCGGEPERLSDAFHNGSARDRLIHAMAMQSDLLMHKVVAGKIDSQELALHCAQLEDMVLEVLPEVQGNPLMMMAAAKLLVDADRRHADLAERLALAAFERTTAFAAAFVTLGQIRAAQGAFVDAIALYDKGLSLSEPGGEFEVYLLVLKCYAALAMADKSVFVTARAALFAAKPAARTQIALVMLGLDEETEDSGIRTMIAVTPPDKLRVRIEIAYALFERRMPNAICVRNILGRSVLAIAEAHGAEAVPPHIARAMRAG